MNRIGVFNVFVASLLLGANVNAQLPSPALTNVFPAVGTRGLKQDVTIAGRDIDGSTRLEFSHPGITGTVKIQPATEFQPERPFVNQFEVTIADNVPLGVYEVKSIGRFGVSSVLPFVVQFEPTVVEAGNNQSIDSPMPIEVDSTVFAQANANAKDFFRFAAEPGQELFIECISDKIDSKLEPIVTLHNADGKVLMRSKSTNEPRFAHSISKAGNYLVSIHDHIYSGGVEYGYGLKVSTAPRIEFVLPAAGRPGATSEHTLYGFHLPGGTESPFVLNGQTLLQQKVNIYTPSKNDLDLEIGKPSPGLLVDTYAYHLISSTGSSNQVSIGITNLPILIEQEPNDHTKPQAVTVPFDMSGTFYPRRDQDWVRFAAKKDQQLVVDLVGHRLGTESDPRIHVWQVVTDGDGNETLKNINVTDDQNYDNGRFTRTIPRGIDTKSNDPQFQFNVPQDGEYCVSVRDLFGNARSDPKSVYRLSIHEPKPDYELIAWAQRYRRNGNDIFLERSSPVVRPGETIIIPVDVIRHEGFTQDITITVAGLPNGVTCADAQSSNGQTEVNLFLSAEEDAVAWNGPIEINSSAKVKNNTISKIARYASISSDTSNLASRHSECRTTKELVLTVVGNEKAAAAVAFEKPRYETSRGGTLTLPVTFIANDKMNGDLSLNLVGLPGQVKVNPLVLKPDAKGGTLEIKIEDSKTPVGKFQVYLAGQGVAIHARDPEAIKLAEAAKNDFEKVFAQISMAETETTTKRDQVKKTHDELASRIAELPKTIESQQAEITKIESNNLAAAQVVASTKQESQLGDKPNEAESAVDSSKGQSQELQDKLNSSVKELEQEQTRQNELAKELAAVEMSLTETTEKKKRAEQHKKSLEEQFNNATKNNAPQDVPVVVLSKPIDIEIVSTPIEVTLDSVDLKLEAVEGASAQAVFSFKVNRRFQFDDAIEFQAVPPNDSGLKPTMAKLDHNTEEGKVELTVGPEVKPGRHKYQLKSKLKFGGVDIEDTTEFILTLTRK